MQETLDRGIFNAPGHHGLAPRSALSLRTLGPRELAETNAATDECIILTGSFTR